MIEEVAHQDEGMRVLRLSVGQNFLRKVALGKILIVSKLRMVIIVIYIIKNKHNERPNAKNKFYNLLTLA